MSKHTATVRGNNLQTAQGKGSSFEGHVCVDDSLLPEAAELEKLKSLDPGIIDWVKERTAKEQDARHALNFRKMAEIEKSGKRAHHQDLLVIFCAVIVILSGMGFSYILINSGNSIVGSVFAGGTLLVTANSFLRFRRPAKQNSQIK